MVTTVTMEDVAGGWWVVGAKPKILVVDASILGLGLLGFRVYGQH